MATEAPTKVPMKAGGPTLDLAYATQINCELVDQNTMKVSLMHGGRELHSEKITQDKSFGFKFKLPFIKVDLELDADLMNGQLTGSGYIEVENPVTRVWHDLFRADHHVFATFDPSTGAVGGDPELQDAGKPIVDAKHGFGGCALATPNILRIHVTDDARMINNIGQMVKQRLFRSQPDFVFNTVASVGGTDEPYTRHYTDPESPWFNLFLGYYQIDAPESTGWTRPFGYKDDNDAVSQVDFDELALLGKADWNWFSNWNYGIPLDAIEAADALDRRSPFKGVPMKPKKIGNTWWHHIAIRGFVVASTYESDHPGAAQLRRNSVLSGLWRRYFGPPCPRPGHDTSFIATKLDAELFMAYHEADDTFHTSMFGGTIAEGEPPGLLTAQLAAVEKVMEKCYPDLGFDDEPPAPVTTDEFDIEVPDLHRFEPGTRGGEWTAPVVQEVG
jgi:hypothetical protein